jgi:Flp pilus assembly protein TadG
MKARERSLGNWIIRRFRAAPAQSMVEFAMALPVLLLATFGVIEFGRLLQAWLALENGARFGARYAITGEFNKAYCDEADAALGLISADGNADCKVEVADPNTATDAEKELARDRTQALQDWARMPSIRDASLSGASGIALDESVSGNYLQYLVDAKTHGTTFSSDYRGDPSKPGFFMISICSNRVGTALTGVTPPTFPVFLINDPALDPSLARYYPGHTGESD